MKEMTKNIPTKIDSKFKLKEDSEYEKGSFNYPEMGISVSKKDKDYHRQWCEKIYSLFLGGKTWMSQGVYNKIDEDRAYSNGTQNTQEIIDSIIGVPSKGSSSPSPFNADGFDQRDDVQVDETTGADRTAWINLDRSPVSVAPKIKTKINEHTRALYYEMSAKAIDSYSVRTEELEKYKLYFYKENKKWLDSQAVMVGISQQDPVFMPQNLDELELYAQTGGFKVPYATAIEDLLKHTFEVSDWDKEVAEKVKDDLFTIGYAIIREKFDREINRVVVQYEDPKYSGMQFSSTKSFKNSEYSYGLNFTELSVIRQRLGLSFDEAATLAKAYAGKHGNPTDKERWENYQSIGNDSGVMGCDSFKIPEFSCEWIDIDNEQTVSFIDNFGRSREKDYKGELQENEKLTSSEIRYVRKCSWIVGSDYVYDWGKSEYLPRDRYGRPLLSRRGVMLSTEPILRQIKPFIRGFQLSWIKAQHAIANAVGNGLAVDIGSIKQIAIGKDKSYDPMEVLRFYKQSSFLVYKKKETLSGFGRSVSPPIIPINNSTYENIKIQFEAMSNYMSLIESTSGISATSTGQTADPDVSKFGMEISVQGTNQIINSIVRAVTDLQEDVSTNICYKIRSLCDINPYIAESYAEVIGETRMKAVLDAEKNHVEYGITIEASDISEQKRTIINLLQSSMSVAGGDDSGRLTPSEAIIILDMIEQRQNLRRVGLILGYILSKKAKEAKEAKMAYIKEQNDGLAKMEAQKEAYAQKERMFQAKKIEMEWWANYTVKHGTPPAFSFGGNVAQPQQNIPPMQQEAQQEQVLT